MRKYCVIGNPVGHSKSPQLFERFSTERGFIYGTDVIYERNEITDKEQLERFVSELRRGVWAGCNVTMPWKTEMVHFMDEISDIARITDAVNTVSSAGGRLYGDSTDGRGMLNPIKEVMGKERIGAAVILGCGGAARSIIAESLLRNTGKVTIVCRGVNESEGDRVCENSNVTASPSNLDLTLNMLKRIKKKNTEIDKTKKSLKLMKKKIRERKDGLNNRLRTMYKNGVVGYLDIILNSNDVTELITNVDMVQRIYKADQDTLDTLVEERMQIEAQESTLKTEKAQLKDKKSDMKT